jgi:hypothetical protein
MAKKFPDLSGDGKTTMKDILIGRGVIKKKKKKKKKEKNMPGTIKETRYEKRRWHDETQNDGWRHG